MVDNRPQGNKFRVRPIRSLGGRIHVWIVEYLDTGHRWHEWAAYADRVDALNKAHYLAHQLGHVSIGGAL